MNQVNSLRDLPGIENEFLPLKRLTEIHVSIFKGENHVVVSLFASHSGLNVDNFNLKSQSPDDENFAILCEKGKVLTENNCTHITQKCLLTV